MSAQVHITESEEASEDGYREAATRRVVELDRFALAPSETPPLLDTLKGTFYGLLLVGPGVLLSMPFFAGSRSVDAIAALVGGGILFLVGALLIGAFVYLSASTRLWLRGRADERPAQNIRIRIDATGLTTEARADESWDGHASTEDIRRVFASRGGAGFHRVRVGLASDAEVTVLDGLKSFEEAESMADIVRERLAQNRPGDES